MKNDRLLLATSLFPFVLYFFAGCSPPAKDFKNFVLHGLYMSWYDPLPLNNAYGYGKAKQAFNQEPSNTALVFVKERYSLALVDSFRDATELTSWARRRIEEAGDKRNNSYAVLAAIHDYNSNVPIGTLGLTHPRTDTNPARSYVLFKQINDRALSGGWDEVKKQVLVLGTTVHELGHARGITGDEYYVNPPHAGPDQSNCIMWPAQLPPSLNPPTERANLYNPYFCEGHRNFLKNVSW